MNSRKSEVRCRLRLSAVLVEACDEQQGTCGERYLGPRRRVRGIRRAALRLRGDGTLVRRMGVHGDLLRIRLGDHSLVGPPRPRTLGRAVVRPGTEGTTTLGQGVRGRDHAALCRLADLDAPGCREIRMVGGACLLTDLGSSGTGAHFVHRVLDLPGERVSRPVVKVRVERGQSVVTSGPYRYVRHPMYASTLLFFPASALLLERVMNLGESRIEMRITRSAWFPRDLCFPHS